LAGLLFTSCRPHIDAGTDKTLADTDAELAHNGGAVVLVLYDGVPRQ
jgi:hypothetical protein